MHSFLFLKFKLNLCTYEKLYKNIFIFMMRVVYGNMIFQKVGENRLISNYYDMTRVNYVNYRM